jgi:hypothetical protein
VDVEAWVSGGWGETEGEEGFGEGEVLGSGGLLEARDRFVEERLGSWWH